MKHKNKIQTCLNCSLLHKAKPNIFENGKRIKGYFWVCTCRWWSNRKKPNIGIDACEIHEFRCKERR